MRITTQPGEKDPKVGIKQVRKKAQSLRVSSVFVFFVCWSVGGLVGTAVVGVNVI